MKTRNKAESLRQLQSRLIRAICGTGTTELQDDVVYSDFVARMLEINVHASHLCALRDQSLKEIKAA